MTRNYVSVAQSRAGKNDSPRPRKKRTPKTSATKAASTTTNSGEPASNSEENS